MSGHADMQADDLEGQLRNAQGERDLWHRRFDEAQGLCRDCRWWDTTDRAWGIGQTKERIDVRNCLLAENNYPNPRADDAVNLPSKARAYDHEAYHAGLLTEPDFGCNQWAAKR